MDFAFIDQVSIINGLDQPAEVYVLFRIAKNSVVLNASVLVYVWANL